MQAPPPSQRSVQRRSPAADPGPPPSMTPGVPQQRPSQTSMRSSQNSGSHRRQNVPPSGQYSAGAPQLSQIEKSVTHLLVATKQLLETLTQWSRHQATDAQVSDVYVRLGYEFNIACRAFSAINVETSDLGNVPEELRHILESTLSQDASVESLDKYLPKIRDIIIGLLHGLKRKQQKLRQKQTSNGDNVLPRNSSVSSVASGSTGLTNLMNEALPAEYREKSYSDSQFGIVSTATPEHSLPPPRQSSVAAGAPRRANLPARESSRASNLSNQSSISSTTMQNMPVVAPGEDLPRVVPENIDVDSFPPPPPPKQTQNALAALQRGGDLERRASRRYSAYQISKHLGATPGGVPMMPPPQNSPIPNRGRDLRESMNAVRGRASLHNRQKSSQRVNTDVSPQRVPSRISEANEVSELEAPVVPQHGQMGPDDSPIVKTPEDKLRKDSFDDAFHNSERRISGVLTGPPVDALPVMATEEQESDRIAMFEPAKQDTIETDPVKLEALQDQPSLTAQVAPPPQEKDLTLFLQYKTKIKKFVLIGGYEALTIARLQLAFIEKFAWNTHNNGVDLPEIYIQDPVSGVRHELEDMSDIKDHSVLVLNVEVLDEVKRHIDEGLGGLKSTLEGVKEQLQDQKVFIQRVSERQQDAAAKEASRAPMNTGRASWIVPRGNESTNSPTKSDQSAQLSEIASLRHDLAVLRQTYAGFQADVENSMTDIRTKAISVKQLAVTATTVDVKGEAGRMYVNESKKSLNDDADRLVGRVDDLQDVVEDLRKDVVTRGVRPLPRQLEAIAKDISTATVELKRMQDFIKKERPVWTKIWEKELQTVFNDREELTMQEDLAADLEDDLEKASQTFALVEQATKEQLKDNNSGGLTPTRLPRLNHVSVDPSAAKEGVLGEVRALQPNHENRLEAIERAEKARQIELQSRQGGEFQKELSAFVQEGKLKKSGGHEEVERRRIAREEKTRREVWEAQNGMAAGDGSGEFGGDDDDEQEDEDDDEDEEDDEYEEGEEDEGDEEAGEGDEAAADDGEDILQADVDTESKPSEDAAEKLAAEPAVET